VRAARGLAAADRRLRRITHRIRPIRKVEFDEVAARYSYYRGRWPYMSVAAAQAADLIARHRLRTALELGPHIRPLIVGADVMVLAPSEGLPGEGKVLVHDARSIPWPIPDGGYDLFVALQVFEHLDSSQPEVFREVCRVARNAVISLPIDWVMPDPTNCHHGITEAQVLEWFAPRVPTRTVEGNPGPKRRVVFVFEGLRD
jgi:hypothetical protein